MSSYKICKYCYKYEHNCRCLAAIDIKKYEQQSIAKDARILELEQDLERVRLLVPTTAQSMVYKSLLMKYNELQQQSLAKDAKIKSLKDELVEMHEQRRAKDALIEKLVEIINKQPHHSHCATNTPVPFGDKARQAWEKISCNCWKHEALSPAREQGFGKEKK